MSKKFTPFGIDFSRLATSVSYESEDTTIKTDMDTGSHFRDDADPTTEVLSVSFDVNVTQYKELIKFFREVKSSIFYATFPDVDNPEIEKNKYYCFNQLSTSRKVTKKGRNKYTFDFSLVWNFEVTGIDRV